MYEKDFDRLNALAGLLLIPMSCMFILAWVFPRVRTWFFAEELPAWFESPWALVGAIVLLIVLIASHVSQKMKGDG